MLRDVAGMSRLPKTEKLFLVTFLLCSTALIRAEPICGGFQIKGAFHEPSSHSTFGG